MGNTATRRVTIYINDKEVENNIKSIKKEMYKLTSQQAKMTIGSKEYIRTGQEIKKLDRILRNHRESIRNTGGAWQKVKGLLPIVSIGTIIALIGRFSKTLFNLSRDMQGEAVRANIIFGDSLGYIEEQAKLLNKRLGTTDHGFKSLASSTADMLVPLEFARDTAAEMSVEALKVAGALDEWTKGKYGLADVTDRINKALTGEMESLKPLGVVIRQDDKEYKNLIKTLQKTEGVTEKQARAMATLQEIQKQSADAIQQFNTEGNKLFRWQKNVNQGWNQFKENIVKAFEIPVEKKLEEQRRRVNALVISLNDANLKESDRIKILNELKTLAPDIIDDIKKEGEKYTIATEALIKYNDQMINQIVLMKKQKAINDLANKAKAYGSKADEKLIEIRERQVDAFLKLSKVSKKDAELMQLIMSGGIPNRSQGESFKIEDIGLSHEDKMLIYTAGFGMAEDPRDYLSAQNQAINLIAKRNGLSMEQIGLTEEYYDLVRKYNPLIEAQQEALITQAKLEEERNEFARALNIDLTNKTEEETTTGGGGSGEPDKDAIEKRKKLIENGLKAIQELNEQFRREQLSEDEKELDDIRRKYQEKIKIAEEAGVFEEEIATLNAQMHEEIRQKEIEQEKARKKKEEEELQEFEEKKLTIRKEYSLLTAEELEAEELARLQERYDKELISFEDFEKAKQEIEDRYKELQAEKDGQIRQDELNDFKDYLALVEAWTQQSLQTINTLRNADNLKLERLKERQLTAAGDNAERRIQIEEEFAQKQKEIAKKYADIEFAIATAGIIVSTASAIMSTWASYMENPGGIPGAILAGIQTGLLAALSVAQIYEADQQRQAVKQLAEGKYPVIGADDHRLYHAQYHGQVTRSGILNNGRPTLINEQGGEMITTASHLDRILSINPDLLSDWMSYENGVPQRASGKYPETRSPNSGKESSQSEDQMNYYLLNAINRNSAFLNSLLKSMPFKSYIVYDEIKEAEATMNEINEYASGENEVIGYTTTYIPTPFGGFIPKQAEVYRNKRS